MMHRGSTLAAAAVVSVLLAGCSSSPEPPPPSAAEVQDYLDQQASSWWAAISPGEPMPEVQVIRTVAADEQDAAVNTCLQAAGFRNDGSPGSGSIGYQHAVWSCYQSYPVSIDEVIRGGFLGRAQLSYLYTFFRDRTVPCLTLAGLRPGTIPNEDVFMQLSHGYPTWVPYLHVEPAPTTAADWTALVTRCPPPAFANLVTPPPYLPESGS